MFSPVTAAAGQVNKEKLSSGAARPSSSRAHEQQGKQPGPPLLILASGQALDNQWLPGLQVVALSGDPRRPSEAVRPPRSHTEDEGKLDLYFMISMMIALGGFMLKVRMSSPATARQLFDGSRFDQSPPVCSLQQSAWSASPESSLYVAASLNHQHPTHPLQRVPAGWCTLSLPRLLSSAVANAPVISSHVRLWQTSSARTSIQRCCKQPLHTNSCVPTMCSHFDSEPNSLPEMPPRLLATPPPSPPAALLPACSLLASPTLTTFCCPSLQVRCR